jgi:hypothetical protein
MGEQKAKTVISGLLELVRISPVPDRGKIRFGIEWSSIGHMQFQAPGLERNLGVVGVVIDSVTVIVEGRDSVKGSAVNIASSSPRPVFTADIPVDALVEQHQVADAIVSTLVIEMFDCQAIRQAGARIDGIVAEFGAKGGEDDALLVLAAVRLGCVSDITVCVDVLALFDRINGTT